MTTDVTAAEQVMEAINAWARMFKHGVTPLLRPGDEYDRWDQECFVLAARIEPALRAYGAEQRAAPPCWRVAWYPRGEVAGARPNLPWSGELSAFGGDCAGTGWMDTNPCPSCALGRAWQIIEMKAQGRYYDPARPAVTIGPWPPDEAPDDPHEIARWV